jgi:phosphate transport system substrate-binding protein
MATGMARAALGALIAGSLLVAGCGQAPQRYTLIVVDGSSTVGPISKAVADEFNRAAPRGISATVAESGTGGGFSKFCDGTTHVQGASRPILASEMEKCAANDVSYIELPIAFDALTVIVHPDNPVQNLTVEQLALIWKPDSRGVVQNWKDIDPSFPDRDLTLFGPGTASGTFDYFTTAVVGASKASRDDYSPSENDNNIILGVSGDVGALGYLGRAYWIANQEKVRALGIIPAGGTDPVMPTIEGVRDGAYTPLTRPEFIYVSVKALEMQPVEDFVRFYLQNAGRLSAQVAYVPLPDSAYAAGVARLEQRLVGTAFNGVSEVGVAIDEIMQRDLKTAVAE